MDDVTVIVTIMAGFAASVIQIIVRAFGVGSDDIGVVQKAVSAVLALLAGIVVVATMDNITLDSLEDVIAAAAISLGASQTFYAMIFKRILESNPPPQVTPKKFGN